jgi:hypothetical protein
MRLVRAFGVAITHRYPFVGRVSVILWPLTATTTYHEECRKKKQEKNKWGMRGRNPSLLKFGFMQWSRGVRASLAVYGLPFALNYKIKSDVNGAGFCTKPKNSEAEAI